MAKRARTEDKDYQEDSSIILSDYIIDEATETKEKSKKVDFHWFLKIY